jgi:hypothetical protein
MLIMLMVVFFMLFIIQISIFFLFYRSHVNT